MSEEGRLTGRRLVDGGAMVETRPMRLWVFFLLGRPRFSATATVSVVKRLQYIEFAFRDACSCFIFSFASALRWEQHKSVQCLQLILNDRP
jgi:hypothetical protein